MNHSDPGILPPLIATEVGTIRGNLVPGNPDLPPTLRREKFIVAMPGVFERLWEILKR